MDANPICLQGPAVPSRNPSSCCPIYYVGTLRTYYTTCTFVAVMLYCLYVRAKKVRLGLINLAGYRSSLPVADSFFICHCCKYDRSPRRNCYRCSYVRTTCILTQFRGDAFSLPPSFLSPRALSSLSDYANLILQPV